MNNEKKPPLQSNINIGSFEGLVNVSEVHLNVSQEVIVTTEDKIQLCLIQYLKGLEAKKGWIAPAGILATIVIVLLTSNFDKFILEPSVWKAIFIIAGIMTFVWLIKALVISFKGKTVEDIVMEMKQDSKVNFGKGIPQPIYIHNLKDNIRFLFYDTSMRASVLDYFPIANNLASYGKGTASSQYKNRDVSNIFLGRRSGHSWTLDSGKGQLEIIWDPPISGRYILLINRTSRDGADPWRKALITVNNSELGVLGFDFSGNCVLVIDLSRVTKITNLKGNIVGQTYPGLAGLEIHL